MLLYLTNKGEKRLEKLQMTVEDKWSGKDNSNDALDFLLLNNIRLDGESDIEELLAHPEIYDRDRTLLYKAAHRCLFEGGYIEEYR